MIDYKEKITNHRSYGKLFNNIEVNTESNRGRIINSPAVRRLQQKTQVFPLEINAAVRSRLTHSLEVQQNARYIAREILSIIKSQSKLEEYGLNGLENAFITTVEMASLMHDIGNPPFGHFGELAINEWMINNSKNCFKKSLRIGDELEFIKYEEIDIYEIIFKDLSCFEGNAQAIRLVQTLQNLNLTYTQVASILKYTRSAYEKEENFTYKYLGKKPGYYYSERSYINDMYKILNIEIHARHPLTYIMEAADDISYGIADLEDAVDKGILSFRKLYVLIVEECKNLDIDNYLLEKAERLYKKYEKSKFLQVNSFIVVFRTELVNDLVKHVSQTYLKNHEKVFNGEYDKALIEDDSKYHHDIKILKNIAFKNVFNHSEVETLEIRGNSAIKGLFECYKPLLELNDEEFIKLLNNDSKKAIEKRLYNRLSKKHVNAYYNKSIEIEELKLENYEEYRLLEWYYRTRLIIDFISGMTDEYALNEYQVLSAI